MSSDVDKLASRPEFQQTTPAWGCLFLVASHQVRVAIAQRKLQHNSCLSIYCARKAPRGSLNPARFEFSQPCVSGMRATTNDSLDFKMSSVHPNLDFEATRVRQDFIHPGWSYWQPEEPLLTKLSLEIRSSPHEHMAKRARAPLQDLGNRVSRLGL